MSNTYTYSGNLSFSQIVNNAISSDQSGNQTGKYVKALAFAAAGGTAPTVSGFVTGTLTAAAANMLLADPVDPLGTMGNATYSDGFTVAGSKVKLFIMENLDATNSITVTQGAANGFPLFGAASQSMTLAPGDILIRYWQAGTAALTTGSNDKLTISVSAGSPTATVFIVYGP